MINETLGSAQVDISAPLDKLAAQINQAREIVASGMERTRATVESFRHDIDRLIAAFAVERVAEWAARILETGSRLVDQSNALGISTKSLQTYVFAAHQAGLAQEELAQGLQFFARNVGLIAQGETTPAAKAFAQLGIAIRDVHGNMRPLDDVLEEFLTKLGRVRDPAAANALAMEAMGRSGGRLIPLARDLAAEGFGAIAERAREMGVVIDDDALRKMKELDDEFAVIRDALKAQVAAGFAEALPAIRAFADEIAGAISGLRAITRGGVDIDLGGLSPEQLDLKRRNIAGAIAAVEKEIADLDARSSAFTPRGDWLDRLLGRDSDLARKKRTLAQLRLELEQVDAALANRPAAPAAPGAPVVDQEQEKKIQAITESIEQETLAANAQAAAMERFGARGEAASKVAELWSRLQQIDASAAESHRAALERLREALDTLALAQASTKTEDETEKIRAQIRMLESAPDRMRAVEREEAVLQARRVAGATAADIAAGRTAALDRATAALIETQQRAKDLAYDKDLREQIAALDDQVRVARLNLGVTTQEIEAQHQLAIALAIAADLRKNGIEPMSEEGRRRAELVAGQMQEKFRLDDLGHAQDTVRRLYADSLTPIEKYRRALEDIDRVEQQGGADSQQIARARHQALLEAAGITPEFETQLRAFEQAGNAINSAFIDAIVNGRDLGDVVRSLAADIERAALQAFVFDQMMQAAKMAFAGAGGFSGIISWIGGVIGGFFGAGSSTASQPASAKGFASGGEFEVPAVAGGVDGTLVQFRATPGERVLIDHGETPAPAPAAREVSDRLAAMLPAPARGFASGGEFDVPAIAGGIDGTLVQFRATPEEHITIDRGERAAGSANVVNNFQVVAPPGFVPRRTEKPNAQGGRDIMVSFEEQIAGRMRKGSPLGHGIAREFNVAPRTIER